MVQIPATLLRFPICGRGFGFPPDNPLVDRHWTKERKHNSEDLDSQSDGSEPPCGVTQMFEGQEKQKIQKSGARHPEWHYTTKQ